MKQNEWRVFRSVTTSVSWVFETSLRVCDTKCLINVTFCFNLVLSTLIEKSREIESA